MRACKRAPGARESLGRQGPASQGLDTAVRREGWAAQYGRSWSYFLEDGSTGFRSHSSTVEYAKNIEA